jgi:hypothetical protein
VTALDAVEQILKDLETRTPNQVWVQIRPEQRAAFEQAVSGKQWVDEAVRIAERSISNEADRDKVVAALTRCALLYGELLCD